MLERESAPVPAFPFSTLFPPLLFCPLFSLPPPNVGVSGMEDDDWGLQAVVRSCGGATSTAADGGDPFCALPSPSHQLNGGDLVVKDELRFFSPEIFDFRTAFEELEELCRPFFGKAAQPQQQQLKVVLQQRMKLPSSSPSSGGGGSAVLGGLKQNLLPRQRPLSQATTLRSKRRKNQLKKVVCQVPTDGLCADMWAWRKYGQKPIKGSPFPRGYYRCSSSKGCPARKQVERSRTDPGMFILTYTSDHNHPVPAHRNCLAGSTRHKSPPPAPSTAASANNAAGVPEAFQATTSGAAQSCSPLSSPTAHSSSVEEELRALEKEEEEVAGGEEDDDEEGLLLVNDMEMLRDDDVLFMGLDGIYHHKQTPSASENQLPWTTNSTAAAGGALR